MKIEEVYEQLKSRFSILDGIDDRCGMSFELGWKGLVSHLCERIQDIVDSMPDDDRKKFRVDQIKQKFGTLRFYMSLYDDEIEAAIKEAETLSKSVCETCGDEGKIVTIGGFITPRCPRHADRR